MKQRLISGLIAAIVLMAVIYRAGPWVVFVVVTVISLMSYREFDRLVFDSADRYRLYRIGCLIVFAILALKQNFGVALLVIWFGFIAIAANAIFVGNRSGKFKTALHQMTLEWLGFFYSVSLVGFIFPILSASPSGNHWLLLLFLIVFAGDSFAYFIGRFAGRRSLAKNLSPKKTLEGSLGGLLGSLIAAYLWVVFVNPFSATQEFWLKFWMMVTVTNILAQMGDLFESLLKRSQKEKDSGVFLPGHGGVLDRIDGLSFASPFYYSALTVLLGIGGKV